MYFLLYLGEELSHRFQEGSLSLNGLAAFTTVLHQSLSQAPLPYFHFTSKPPTSLTLVYNDRVRVIKIILYQHRPEETVFSLAQVFTLTSFKYVSLASFLLYKVIYVTLRSFSLKSFFHLLHFHQELFYQDKLRYPVSPALFTCISLFCLLWPWFKTIPKGMMDLNQDIENMITTTIVI